MWTQECWYYEWHSLSLSQGNYYLSRYRLKILVFSLTMTKAHSHWGLPGKKRFVHFEVVSQKWQAYTHTVHVADNPESEVRNMKKKQVVTHRFLLLLFNYFKLLLPPRPLLLILLLLLLFLLKSSLPICWYLLQHSLCRPYVISIVFCYPK